MLPETGSIFFYGIISPVHPTGDNPVVNFKLLATYLKFTSCNLLIPLTPLMMHNPFFYRILIIVFMVLAGFCLAKNIYFQSITGVILAVVGMVAGIYFIVLLNQWKKVE
jgi:hypothetical protein